ncbi:putative reverse transcriptase domain-containing protein [Tanacetum coccineum]
MAVEETLKAFGQWLCGKCMDLHVVSRSCHHPDDLFRFSKWSDDMSGYIVVPVTTVKCTPHGFRLALSQALKTVLCKVVAHPDYVHAWVSSILKSLTTWGKDDGITMLVKSIIDSTVLRSFGQGGGDFLEEGATGNTNIKQCLRKIADGHFTGAVKVLSSFGVALYYIDNVFDCIKSFPKDLLKVITLAVNLWLARRCPPILAEFVASVPLTPLLKPDNRIRPIAVGPIWRRFGFQGCHERLLSECHNDGSLAMLTVDLSNAFNLVDRLALLHEVKVRCPSISLWVDFLYGRASRLYIGDTHISSASGVQQGDPLGPLLFALILHPLLHKIKDGCKLLLHARYIDDGTVIGDSEEVSKVLDVIKVCGPGLGLKLNIKKTEIFWPSCNGMKLHEGLFPIDIRRPSSGVKLLGGAVSRDVDLLVEEEALFFDKGLCGSIENIVVCGGPFFEDLQWRLASLPIRFGGLDLYSAKLVSSYAFIASRAQSCVLQDHILRNSGICGMDDDYVSALACLRDTIPSFDFSGFTNKDTACRISVKKKAHVNFITHPSDGRSTLRPADVLVFGWVGGKHACVDLTGVSPLVGLNSKGFTSGQAALKAASCKVTKHDKACNENQHVFIPFAFDTFGFFAPEAVELLRRVQRVMHINVMTPRSTDVGSKRIGFAI